MIVSYTLYCHTQQEISESLHVWGINMYKDVFAVFFILSDKTPSGPRSCWRKGVSSPWSFLLAEQRLRSLALSPPFLLQSSQDWEEGRKGPDTRLLASRPKCYIVHGGEVPF